MSGLSDGQNIRCIRCRLMRECRKATVREQGAYDVDESPAGTYLAWRLKEWLHCDRDMNPNASAPNGFDTRIEASWAVREHLRHQDITDYTVENLVQLRARILRETWEPDDPIEDTIAEISRGFVIGTFVFVCEELEQAASLASAISPDSALQQRIALLDLAREKTERALSASLPYASPGVMALLCDALDHIMEGRPATRIDGISVAVNRALYAMLLGLHLLPRKKA
jgi:hypothetical protein